MSSTTAFILSMASLAFIIFIMVLEVRKGTLNIKSRPVGDGQYGTARWATQKEINETYRVIADGKGCGKLTGIS